MEKHDNDYTVPSLSPSFSTYSDDRLSQIADRVARTTISDENDEFEFAILQPSSSSSSDGLIFPVFDHNLVSAVTSAVKSEPILTPLKDLFLRERIDSPPQPQQIDSSSSDEEDELDEIPSEIYCRWTPARSTAEMSPSGGCRKSKSTGSSSTSSWSTKRWRIRDLLKRSRSDGKQSLNFLNTNSESPKNKEIVLIKKKEKVSAHEKFYLRNKAIKEEDKRKSYLPYKQDLFGLFSNF
ncbi:hypothetical protein AALP_AA5G049800 [Arabis alpina]|uniref:Uncharacterized protein n=1 Tax=Arabis alpina TaxID=50452 RepID=A0A087GV04_ARAAL|nr:hypothetical protein AALP_AA5G049800 [Arabis alpina]